MTMTKETQHLLKFSIPRGIILFIHMELIHVRKLHGKVLGMRCTKFVSFTKKI